MPTTVLLLIDELEVWGGTETHLSRLLPALAGRVRPVIGVVGGARLAPDFRALGIAVEPLEIYRTFAPSGLLGLRKIARLLRRERAELLVSYHTASDLLGPVAARLVGRPALSCRRDDGFTKKPIHVRAQRVVNHLVSGMIVVSEAVARAVEQSEGYPRHRVRVIWNGEDLARFAPGPSPVRAELGLAQDALVCVCVSSLTPVKDHATLLRAFARLAAGHERAQLLIVGDGPLRAELEALADELAPGRVRFLGHRGDVPDVLRAADVYLQTSRTEGFSNAILQAMASGLPVVTTAVGGNVELVSRSCGELCAPGDVAALAAALARLAEDPERRRRTGTAARVRVEERGSIASMAAAYAEAFERAADQAR